MRRRSTTTRSTTSSRSAGSLTSSVASSTRQPTSRPRAASSSYQGRLRDAARGAHLRGPAGAHASTAGCCPRVFTPERMNALEPKIRSSAPRVSIRWWDATASTSSPISAPRCRCGRSACCSASPKRTKSDAGPGRRSLRTEPGEPMAVTRTFFDGEHFADYIDWRAEHPSDDLMTELLKSSSRTRPARCGS